MPTRIDSEGLLAQVHQNLGLHYAEAARQVQHLSSGRRVDRASDDPASLALADRLNAEVQALVEGNRNVQQSINLLQVADGTLTQVSDIVQRMQSLSVEAATSTFDDVDRRDIDVEFQTLKQEIDRLAKSTTYNKLPLLDAERTFTIQAGPTETGNDASRIALGDMRATGPRLDLTEVSLATRASAREAMDRLRQAYQQVVAERNRIGAFQNRLELSASTAAAAVERMQSAESSVRDLELARSVSALSTAQILSQAASSVAVQANLRSQQVISLLR
jgi:flagellin